VIQRFIVAGVGNFGSWWICGLCKQSNPLEIICYDPNTKARQILLDRMKHIPNRFTYNKKIKFIDDIAHLPTSADLVVISTNSNVRLSVYRNISNHCSSKMWVLEKVLAQSVVDLNEIGEISIGKKVFVNHNRPLQPASQIVKSILNKFQKPRKVTLKGGQFELASNASHFIHLAEYLLDVQMSSIDVTSLASQWHLSSVRSGFFDVKGELKVTLDGTIPFNLDWQDSEKKAANWEFEVDGSIVKYCELTGEININNELYATAPLINFSDLVPLAMCNLSSPFIPLGGLPALDRVLPIHLELTLNFAKHREVALGDISGLIPYS
jgi:hypothetical protein